MKCEIGISYACENRVTYRDTDAHGNVNRYLCEEHAKLAMGAGYKVVQFRKVE